MPSSCRSRLQSLPDTPREEVEIRARSPFLGATVANLSPALADEMRLDPSTQGVVITGVADGSEAQSIGFQKGDMIVSVNDQKIEKPADLQRIAGSGGRQWRITIDAGRAADLGDVFRMSSRPQTEGTKPVRRGGPRT